MIRKLPHSGVQDFAKIRTDYDVYVDKTACIHRLISSYNTVFFSRPRRFGKSLTCSTIKAIFENQRDLFKGLAIESLPWEWKEFPVVHLDMSASNFAEGKEKLTEHIDMLLELHAEKYGVRLQNYSIYQKFSMLLSALYASKGRTAIIIDEYDCPLLDTLDYPQLNREIKEVLRGLYKVIKGCDQYIQFVFITGITKFAQVSLFSGMNQPEDISFNAHFAALCGFTQSELETYFAPEISEYSPKFDGKENYIARLKNFYNGYKFAKDAHKIYNPISVMKHFGNDADFRVFWAETGTPNFLAQFVDKNGADLTTIETMELPPEAFGKYNEDEITLVPLMYQAGYLTIKDYNSDFGTYTLCYPNTEVRSSFSEFLSKLYTNLDMLKRASTLNKLYRALQSGDVDAFMEAIKIYMQSIKFDLITKMTEYYFEFAFSNILNMLGFNCETEVHSAIGSVDAIVKLQKNVFVIEAKLDKPVKDALKQIEEKKYYIPYTKSDFNLYKIGVVFGGKERNITEWRFIKCAE